MLIGKRVTVAGGGIGGMAAALALARRGARVTLLERAERLRETGAGLQVSPNGAAVLEALGLGAALRGAGLLSRAVELRDGLSGRRVLRMDLARPDAPAPFVLVERGALLALLAEAARDAGVEIRTGTAARPEDRLPDEALRVGAEGLRSPSRAALNQGETPFFTGQVAWRAVIQGDAPPESQVWMGPGRHLVTYPLPGGRRNIVAVEERAEWAEEGWSHPGDPAELRRAFAGFAPEVTGWLAQVEHPHLWGLFRHPVAGRWQDGRLALLGDAAHPTLPFLAQGANLALEDAWVLADCLATLPQAEALALYEARRRGRAARTVAAAEANARNFHLRGPQRLVAHNVLRLGGRVAPRLPLARFDWLYRHDVTREG
jgi:salicylate hydroxylase